MSLQILLSLIWYALKCLFMVLLIDFLSSYTIVTCDGFLFGIIPFHHFKICIHTSKLFRDHFLSLLCLTSLYAHFFLEDLEFPLTV